MGWLIRILEVKSAWNGIEIGIESRNLNGNFWQNIGNQTALGSISKRFMSLQIVGRLKIPILQI